MGGASDMMSVMEWLENPAILKWAGLVGLIFTILSWVLLLRLKPKKQTDQKSKPDSN